MKRRYKILRAALMGVFTLAIFLLVAGIFLSRYARKRFDSALASSGITISSLHVNLFTRSVTIDDFNWTLKPDSATLLLDSIAKPFHQFSAQRIYAGGINIYQLLRNKKIEVHNLTFDGGDLIYNKAIRQQKDSTEKKPSALHGLSIDGVFLKNIHVALYDDSVQEYTGNVSVSLGKLSVKDLDKLREPSNYNIDYFETAVTGITMNQRDGMYGFKISKMAANSSDKTITIDSISILPKYSKYKFSRKVGRQVDRFVALIPAIAISGVDFTSAKDSLFRAERIEINNANLHIYRDKRLPFIKEKNLPLPIAMIREFTFGLAIDTLKIKDSRIRYELFPEKGYHSGEIIFQHLNATLDHLSNRNFYAGYSQATLLAESKVYGNGVIKATFSLPYGPQQIYNAKGVITNIALYKVSPMLENVAFISIESGKLNNLNFNFDYNDLKSTGSILLNYKDLKVKTLTKEKDPDTNEFKSFIANLILKKDKDKGVPIEKRTGTIDYERERKRAVFHLWVKSLFSGLKSSVLDSPAKKDSGASKVDKKKSTKEDADKDRRESKKQKAKAKEVRKED